MPLCTYNHARVETKCNCPTCKATLATFSRPAPKHRRREPPMTPTLAAIELEIACHRSPPRALLAARHVARMRALAGETE